MPCKDSGNATVCHCRDVILSDAPLDYTVLYEVRFPKLFGSPCKAISTSTRRCFGNVRCLAFRATKEKTDPSSSRVHSWGPEPKRGLLEGDSAIEKASANQRHVMSRHRCLEGNSVVASCFHLLLRKCGVWQLQHDRTCIVQNTRGEDYFSSLGSCFKNPPLSVHQAETARHLLPS